jgi:dolichol-phosphate mannosyltransferase
MRDDVDIVSAARRLEDNETMEGLSPLRRRLSQIGNALSSFVIGRKLSDPLTGFFLIRRERFRQIAPNLGDPGFKLLLDILYTDKTLRHGEVYFNFGTRLHGSCRYMTEQRNASANSIATSCMTIGS